MSTIDISKFHVIAVVSNPVRYRSRWELFRQFQTRMLQAGVNLTTVELVFGARTPFLTTEHQRHVRLRSYDELWHKENLINIGISRLPEDWEYVAWIDADVQFVRPDWVEETIHQLQHYMIVQMWETAADLGPRNEIFATYKSFGSLLVDGQAVSPSWKKYGYEYPHTGYAWAARREAIEIMGGLLDKAVLGAADHHMAWSFLGQGLKSCPPKIHPNYTKMVAEWQTRAAKLKRDIGFVPGSLLHYWHGKKKDRKYVDRWQVLIKNGFDPEKHLVRGVNGLYEWSDSTPIGLRDGVRAYMRQRHEDSIDLL